jgi:single-strand DNA-binding protein
VIAGVPASGWKGFQPSMLRNAKMLMNNMVMLKGFLGADAEIRSTNSDDRVANLRVCTKDIYKDRETGDYKERPEWHRITVWGNGSITHLEKHGKKGARVDILGQLRTRKFTDGSGTERYSTEIVCDYRAGGEISVTPREPHVAESGSEIAS